MPVREKCVSEAGRKRQECRSMTHSKRYRNLASLRCSSRILRATERERGQTHPSTARHVEDFPPSTLREAAACAMPETSAHYARPDAMPSLQAGHSSAAEPDFRGLRTPHSLIWRSASSLASMSPMDVR